ncbi:hypothetical protein ACL6C3_14065 [Capilliphycus salinus ALCB114379]|uniref:hypothetical protein n=1 Tax=Capilliphycus salinus TaxID=2768948 RepID=UPI0039A5682D
MSKYQQNLQLSSVAVIVMVASSNRLPNLIPLIPDVRNILAQISPGQVIEVGQ